ncbi:MAG: PepSY domain-containing protein [Gammaproteobacteria bacterium]|nr:PepSY domain-containing protein [Gammaproteobacteria bacterium]
MREIQPRSITCGRCGRLNAADCRPCGLRAFARRYGLLVVYLLLGLAAFPALSADDCEVPVQQWQSREAVRQMAAAQGWEVQRLKIDDGCYEIHGKDSQGRTFKAKIDPQSLKVVKIKYKDHHRDRERERTFGGARPVPADSAAVPRNEFN